MQNARHPKTHRELCELACRFLRNNGFKVGFGDRFHAWTPCGEHPDALGFRNGALAGIIGLGGFDILNGYAATSWLTMLEVVVVAAVLSAVYKGMKYNDSKKNIIILAVIAGVTKIFTSYATMVVAALMAGTALQPALVAAFLSLLATVINSCSTAVCTPILYFALKDITVRVMKRAH